MIKLLAITALVAAILVYVSGVGDENMLGPGRWSVLTIQQCDNHEDYELKFDVRRYLVSRTSAMFKGKVDLKDPITEDWAMRLEICKQADGGCKPYQVMADDSFCAFVHKHAEKNFQAVMNDIGVEHLDCPIPPKEYDLQHVIDYNDLPKEAVYGVFGVKALLIKDKKEFACMYLEVEFKKDDDDDDGDDE